MELYLEREERAERERDLERVRAQDEDRLDRARRDEAPREHRLQPELEREQAEVDEALRTALARVRRRRRRRVVVLRPVVCRVAGGRRRVGARAAPAARARRLPRGRPSAHGPSQPPSKQTNERSFD